MSLQRQRWAGMTKDKISEDTYPYSGHTLLLQTHGMRSYIANVLLHNLSQNGLWTMSNLSKRPLIMDE